MNEPCPPPNYVARCSTGEIQSYLRTIPPATFGPNILTARGTGKPRV